MAINSARTKNSNDLIDDFIKVRKARHMSQAEVAKKANLHQAAVGRIENKSTEPRLDTLMRMLDTMGYTLAIIPAFQEDEHAINLEINSVLGSLKEENLKRIKAYADELYAEELQKKKEAFDSLMKLARPIDLGDDYKAILMEELDRKYGMYTSAEDEDRS